MSDLDVTRLSDYTLAERYFDWLDRFGKDGDDVERMKVELEERDILFKGYFVCGWTPHFTVDGCRETFTILEDLKDYINSRGDIEPNENGSMHYTD